MFDESSKPTVSPMRQFWQGAAIGLGIGIVSIFATALVWAVASGTNRDTIVLSSQPLFLIGGGIVAGRFAYRDGLKVRIAGLITVLSAFLLLASGCWGLWR
jgi:hypothetical protein